MCWIQPNDVLKVNGEECRVRSVEPTGCPNKLVVELLKPLRDGRYLLIISR